MKLEQQVCSLELSKRLKELGVKQESLFVWRLAMDDKWHLEDTERVYSSKREKCSAFTVAELGEMLPSNVNIFKKNRQLRSHRNSMFWVVDYLPSDEYIVKTGKNEADARAKMLIYLIENKLMGVAK
jgi:hypothetical protein